MDEQQLIRRNGNVVEASVDDEIFVLDVEGGNCFGFNVTATEIWRALEKPITLGALCDMLMEVREVDRSTCLQDTFALLEVLARDELVVIAPA